ncbi:acyltransferase family protein [Larkinella soli]|uniref:acyltransferase family protein n=1 Tax=Larkinella soli TaxID=1770527 RepID=UPI000FFBCDB4|nr:acyltransferase [Larkinella soli]
MKTGLPDYLPTLTPLRGIAAVWVVAYHVEVLAKMAGMAPLTTTDTTWLLLKGYSWVDFFFLLSGFIMTHVYGDGFRFGNGYSGARFRTYLTSRIARLYPLHLFCLMVHIPLALVLAGGFPEGVARKLSFLYPWEALPVHLLMLQHISRDLGFTWNVPDWSIGAEWWTYLLAVLLFRLLHRKPLGRSLVLAAGAMAGLGLLIGSHPKHLIDLTWGLGQFRCLFEFTIGIVLYQLYRRRMVRDLLRSDLSFLVSVAACLYALHRSGSDLWLIPAFGGLLLSAAANQGIGRRWLTVKPLRYLGDISYSVYMMQSLWLNLYLIGLLVWGRTHDPSAIPEWVKLLLMAGVVAGTLLSASLTHRFVEIPGRRWLQSKLEKRRSAEPVSVAV